MSNPNWVKGRSANPAGRPKAKYDIQALARALTHKALAALERAIESDSPQAVSASNTLLAYGYGKPMQTTNLRIIKDVSELTDAELAAIAGEGVELPALPPPDAKEDASE